MYARSQRRPFIHTAARGASSGSPAWVKPWGKYDGTTATPTAIPASFTPSSQLPDPAPTPEKGDHPDFGDPVNEIKTKLLIREDKKQYEENLARAKEADDLAAELCTSYEAKRTFTYEDEKKLERLEKLTKRIRNEAGGSDKNTDENDPPNIVENAVKKVAETADVLRKEVEKTPRRVVSAAVIDQANKLIGLIQYLRNQGRR